MTRNCYRCGRSWCTECAPHKYVCLTSESSQTDSVKEFSFTRFLTEEELTDVEIAVENDRFPDQRRSFKAHRMILALRNEVFKAMFYGNFAKEERVVITDLHPEGVLGLLRYFYSGCLEVDSVYQAVCTRTAAIKYLEPELAEKCTAYVKRNMVLQDVCPVLDYVLPLDEDHSDFPLKTLLQAQSQSVLSSKELECCLVCTVHYVVDHVVNVPELSVMRAVHAWALKQRSNSAAADGEESSLRTIMQPFFPKLRFLALTAEEFVSGPNQWGALSQEEALAVISNIIKRGSLPLPERFCDIDRMRTSSVTVEENV